MFNTPSFCYKIKVLRPPIEIASESGHWGFVVEIFLPI